MRVAAISAFGPPEVLRTAEAVEPYAGAGEVRIRVKAAGVQPFDCKARAGLIPFVKSAGFPLVPGNEFSGVVDQVGEGVDTFAEGDDVLGFGVLNGYAEYLTIPADQIVRKPDTMPWDIAAGLSGNGQGAHMALRELEVGPGDTVLINGAAGGLGTLAVQVAKAWGATTVIGTASKANHDYLRELGAVPVEYGVGLADRVRALAPDGVDAALDSAGGDGLRALAEVTKDRNRVLTMVDVDTAKELGLREWTPVRSAARLAELVDLYEAGRLTVHLRATYPLERAADAHRDVETGHGRGKVVLTIG
ncbi:NADP-dependent oxidoreductase [Streptomyces sp. NPDC058279]|uniref:NADP-dependent oxidoreductase n=1 Tax=Streptomyces sp. NPDC058279 TaxID=3346418 RepID=UPI0036F02048